MVSYLYFVYLVNTAIQNYLLEQIPVVVFMAISVGIMWRMMWKQIDKRDNIIFNLSEKFGSTAQNYEEEMKRQNEWEKEVSKTLIEIKSYVKK